MSAIAIVQDPAPVPTAEAQETGPAEDSAHQAENHQAEIHQAEIHQAEIHQVDADRAGASQGRTRNLVRTARRHVHVVHEDAVASSQCLERQARRWSTFRNGTAPLVAVSAATAGFAGLSGLVGHEAAGLVALGSAALSGTLTALNPVKRAQSLEKKAQRWDSLADATQRCLDFELLADGSAPDVHCLEQLVKNFEDTAGKIGENHRPSHKPTRSGRRSPVRSGRPSGVAPAQA